MATTEVHQEAIVTGTSEGAAVRPSPRRISARLVAAAAGVTILAGGLTAYGLSRSPHEELAKARQADAARWQAQANAYLQAQWDTARARQANAARWQGRADANHQGPQNLTRGQLADAARWQGQADEILGGVDRG